MTSLLPDRQLAISLAPPHLHPALLALFTLDQRLADIARTTREPLIGQMRITWWREALIRLDTDPAPAEPLLQDIARHLLPRGIAGADFGKMIDGWEVLIVADTLDDAALADHAGDRGGGVFALAARLLGCQSALLAPAGQGWAYADLAVNLSDPAATRSARERAAEQFSRAFAKRWPAPLRTIGLLSLLARMDAEPGSPIRKALAVTRFRLLGR